MEALAVSELQKNISILSKSLEPIEIIDKRANRVLGVFYPANNTNVANSSIVDELAGKYELPQKYKNMSWKEIREEAWRLAMEDKYGKIN